MRISDWSSDVCSSDLTTQRRTLSRRRKPLVARPIIGTSTNGNTASPHPRAPSTGATASRRANGPTPSRRSGSSLGANTIRSAKAFTIWPASTSPTFQSANGDRKSVVYGKSVSVRVDLGGRRTIKKKLHNKQHHNGHLE